MPRHPHEPVTPMLPFPPMPPAPPCGCVPPRMRPEPFSPGGLPAPHGFDFGRWAREKIGWLLSLVPSAASPDNLLADREWVAGQAVSGKADKVADAAEGNLAALTQDGNLADSGTKPDDFATAAQGAKADTAVQPAAIAGFVDGAEYDAEYGDPPKPTILLKHGSEVVAAVDAADFVIDGMVSNVEVKNGNLVITFNTDSGKQPISIPLTDIFNPDNYYDKTAADGKFVAKEAGKGLSTEDYTTAEKTKLGGIAAGAQVNVIEMVEVNGTALTPQDKAVDIPVPTLDNTVTPNSGNGVKSSGIWSAIWGALASLPTGFSSLYDWCVAQFTGKFAQYYPDGSVKSTAEFTPGIKYDSPDTVNRTITVKPFCKTRTAENDNSGLVGRVVIPPFVDASGNPYITDDGTRFRVVGVSGTDDRIFANTNPTAIVAPNTVTTIGGSAFIYCTALSSVSLPAATTVGDYAFAGCVVLASVDFGDTPRPDVPSLGVGAFNNVPATCKIIVPYTQYDAWKAASGWSALQQEFVRHAEKADKPATFTTDNLAKFDLNGNPVDSGKKPSDFQSALSDAQLANIAAVSDALAFDATRSYAAGDPVVYNGTLYTFTATHTGAWIGSDASAVDIIARLAGKADKVAYANDGNLAALDANGNLKDSNNIVQGTFGCGELVVGYFPNQRYIDIIAQGAVSDHCTIVVYNSDSLGHYHYIALPNSYGADKESICALEREIAPAFDDTATYAEGALVYYNDALYRCITAVTSAGAWTGSTNWTSASVEDVLAALRTTIAGKANASDLLAKLDSTSAAPAFSSDSSVSYAVGSHVTYNGKLYVCTTATTGGTWVAGSWTADTMTDPDAVLDITSQNQLRVVAKDGTLLWAQGYDLVSTSSATLACDAANNFTFADGATSQAFTLPTAPTGKVGDFGLDIDNSANTGAATMTLTGLDSTFSVVVPEGESLNDMLAIAAGELARFYISLSTFRVNSLPTWHIVKQVVENGGATA